MTTRAAIGYLRTDISGARQQWDESRISSVAGKLGYDLRKTVAWGLRVEEPMKRLRVQLSRLGLSTIVTPNLDHFDGKIPGAIREVADVITVSPEMKYMRRPRTVSLADATFAVSPEVMALLASAAEIAEAGGRDGVDVEHVLLAMLRNPEITVGPLREIGIGPETYGKRLAQLTQPS
ncbi:hypothetical protein [Nocardia sp. NPDC059239]|uniref:hypothetical protein n=1 Tax=Nocardia sp. NPDC059239 TaxID=3346785 RepID=UPI0036A54E48